MGVGAEVVIKRCPTNRVRTSPTENRTVITRVSETEKLTRTHGSLSDQLYTDDWTLLAEDITMPGGNKQGPLCSDVRDLRLTRAGRNLLDTIKTVSLGMPCLAGDT